MSARLNVTGLDSIGGNCPVQGWGSVDGLGWYFRARHSSWSLEIYDTDVTEGKLPAGDPVCEFRFQWGTTSHGAGYMSKTEAEMLIIHAIEFARGMNFGRAS